MSEHAHDQAYWDGRYRSADRVWSGHPNAHLVGEASAIAPGTALDVGCGEGADAIWLAERGWQVTAVDVSTVALDRAAANAAGAGDEVSGRITWQHLDLTRQAPTGPFDLVSVQFLHLPPAQRDAVLDRLAAIVSAGGSLLVVGHHPSDLQTTVRRPRVPELFFTGADLAARLPPDDWQVVTDAAPERTVADPDGRPVAVRDTVFRARRTDTPDAAGAGQYD